MTYVCLRHKRQSKFRHVRLFKAIHYCLASSFSIRRPMKAKVEIFESNAIHVAHARLRATSLQLTIKELLRQDFHQFRKHFQSSVL